MKRVQNIKRMLKKAHGGLNNLTGSLTTYRTKPIASLSSPNEAKKSYRGRLAGKLHFKISKTVSKINAVFKGIGNRWNNLYTQKLPFQKIGALWKAHYPTYKKYLVPVSIGMLIVLVPVVWLSVKNPDKVFADWFDDNWHYRKTITLTNPGAPDSDKKILFETDTATLISESKMQNTCADARFVDINGQVLEHYIDSANGACNTISTDFYVLLPTINKGSTVIYFYYGNAYAESIAQTSQFSQATFSPSQSSTGSETAGPGPAAYWKFDEAYDQKENTIIEQQLEIMNTPAALSWLPGSTKQRVVTVTNSNASALTDFQVLVNVTYDSDMNSDFSDIRFTNVAGTELDHWLESKTDSTSAKFWVEVPSIAASADTTIYLHYGNPSASSASNGDNTFVFFDDFSGSVVDTNKWTVVDATGISVADGVLNATSTTGWLQSNSAFSKAQQPVIEAKVQHVTMPTNGYNPISTWLSTTDTFGGLIHPGSPFRLYHRNNGTWTSIYDSAVVSNLLVRLRIYSNSTAAIYYYNYDTDALVVSATGLSNSVDNEPLRFVRREDNINTGQTMDANWDYILVRNGTTSDPSTSVSTTESTNESFYPEDASLGIAYFAPENYSSETVYLEAVVSLDGGSTWTRERSPEISAISSRSASSYAVKIRAGDGDSLTPTVSLYDAITLESIYELSLGNTSNTSLSVNNARLIIKQESGVGITQTDTKTEIGSNESSSNFSYTQQTDKKIYNYDSSKYSPTPTNFFETTAETSLSGGVSIEQRINIMTAPPYTTSNSGTYLPTDNSLGLAYWDADLYPGATVYLEVEYLEQGWGDGSYALYSESGTYVGAVGSTGDGYGVVRSGALTLVDNTNYTVRAKAGDYWGNTGSQIIIAARLVVKQSDSSKITATETQIDIGSTGLRELHSAPSYTQMYNPKNYYYDSSKFDPVPTAYFETTLESSQPTIEQHIDLLNNPFTVASTTYVPTDNSLGLFYWDADKYPDSTVYLEFDYLGADWGSDYLYVGLFSEAGTQVIEANTPQTNDEYGRIRSAAVTLTDNTAYTVRAKSTRTAYVNTQTVLAARLIIIQSNSTKITGTETNVDIGDRKKLTNTSYAQMDAPKTFYYDSSKYTPAPTAYFEAILESPPPTIEQQINILNGTYSVNTTSYLPTDNSLGLVYWDADKYPDSTVYLEADVQPGGWVSNAYVALYSESGSAIGSVSTGDVSGGSHRIRSGALTLTDNTAYTVRARSTNTNTQVITAARLIVIQSNSTKITGTGTQVELGSRTTTTSTTYTGFSDTKVWRYDSSKYTPAPTAYFEATLSNDTADQTTYAALYTDGETCSSQVTGSEVSVTGTTWSHVQSGSITLSTDTDYSVCIKAGANTARIANAKIILDQSDANGIRDLELYHMQVNSLMTDADATYSNAYRYTLFNPGISATQISFEGGNFNYFYEATLKTSAGTGYARLINATSGAAISGGEITTAATTYTRVRSGDISSGMPTAQSTLSSGQTMDTQIRNSATNTTSVANSWVVIQVTDLANTSNTVYAELYNLTDGTSVSGSELSTTSTQATRLKSSEITLTSGKEYVVRTKTSSTDNLAHYLSGAKIILDQSDANGISALEIMYPISTYVFTDSDTTYSGASRYKLNSSPNILGANSAYYFEATLKTSGGTGYAKIYDVTATASITNSEITTASTTFTRVRSGDLYYNLPSGANAFDLQLKNSATNTTTAGGTWVVAQISNIGNPEGYIALYPNGTSCANQISGSEIGVKPSEGIKNSVSSSISVSDGNYMICTRTPNGVSIVTYNAKISHYQSGAQGITSLRTFRALNTDLMTESTSTYVSKNSLNSYDPATFTGVVVGSFDATLSATGSTAYAQLYNTTGAEAVTGTEISTASTSYTRVQTSDITLPISASELDIQIKNGSTSTTKSTASWLVLDITNELPAIAHDSTSNKINGQLNGPTWETAQYCVSGSCLKFGGDGDYVKVTDNSRLDFGASDSFTISMWFTQPHTTTGTQAMLSKFESTGSDGGYQIAMDSTGKVAVGIGDDNTNFPEDSITSTASYRDSKWHHVALVKNGSTSITLYVDGVVEGTDETLATTGALTNNDLLYIGLANDGATGSWLGNLDEIKIYRYARTAGEIENELNSASSTNTQLLSKNVTGKINNGLVGHWKLEETTTNSCATLAPMDACDETANGYDAYWDGDASYAPGKIGNSIVLDGTGDALRVQQEWSKIKITFDNSASAEDLTDFPVLVKVGSSRINYTKTQDLGQDIRFTDSDGTTLLSHEIEKWDEAGDSFVWVKVPNIPAGSTTDYIYMYFNDPALSDGQSPENVWDSSHVGVWHLKESTGTNIADSTTNSNNGTKTLETQPAYTADGAINGGHTFDSSNTTVSIPNNATFNMGNVMTLEAWVKPTTCASRQTIIGANNASGVVQLEINNGSCAVGTIVNGIYISYTGTNALTAGQWNHIVYTRNGTGATHKIYVNGVEKTLSTNASNNYTNPTVAFEFGRRNTAGSQKLTGTLDEVRMSGIARSVAWVKATYLTATDVFNTFGTEESYIPDFNISDQITVSGWYYPTTLDNTTKFLISGSGTSKSMYLKTDSANTGKLLFSTNGTDEGTSSTALTINNWYYVTLTGNPTETKLYINGALDSTVENTTGVSDLETFIIGNDTNLSTNGFIGKVDEVKLYNTALSLSDISTTYTSPKGPVAYYTFDQKDIGAVFDISTNNYPATWSGSTTNRYVTGKFGSAGVFNGSSDYAQASDVPFDLTTDFTLESWINLGTAGSAPYNIISKHGAEGSGGYSLFVDANGAVNCLTDNGTSETVSKTADSAVTSSSGWVHVSAVREGTSCKVFINSEDKTATAGTHTTMTANDLNLRLGSNTSGSGFFKGYMDEVKIYDYAITPKALLVDYNAGHAIPGSPVGSAKAWWKMDEGYGATIHNTGSSGSANDGTITGATWSLEGKYDRALDFDGTSDYITVATGEIINQDTVTIEAWIYPTSVTGAHDFTILAQNDNGAGYTTHNFGIAGSTGKLMYDNELPSDGVLSGNTVLTANQWQHVAVVRDADSVTFYVNGASDGNGTGEARTSAASIDNTLIGARYYSGAPQHQFAGKLDDVKVYTVALSASQVAQAFNRGKAMAFGSLSTDTAGLPLNSAKSAYCVPGDSSSCNPPVADYSFDEKQGTSLNDLSGNGHTGTITNEGSYGGTNPKWTNGNIGGALEFGNYGYVEFTDDELIAQDNITVEAWIYPGKVSGGSSNFPIYVQNKNDSQGVTNFSHLFAIDYTNGKLKYDNSPAGGSINSNTALSANAWYHVAITRNGNAVTFYLNGKSDGSGTGETRDIFTAETLIGAKYYWVMYEANVDQFIGKISHLTVYDYARTPGQIAWDYDRGNPSLWWKLDECQGLVANDSSKQGAYDGVITIGATGTTASEGSCSSEQSDEAWSIGSTGVTNAGIYFDGTDDYISLGTGPSIYAVSFWVKPASTTQSIVDLDGGTHTISVSGGTISAAGFSSPTVYVDGYPTTSLPDTNWHQITVVDTTPLGTSNITLGKINTSLFTGQIDEFKLFSYPMTATQVRQNVVNATAVFN